MVDPEFSMMLAAFMETAKRQNADLVDGAALIFIPRDGNAQTATVMSWLPDEDNRRPKGVIWHDTFIALMWSLLKGGLDPNALREMTEYSIANMGTIRAGTLDELLDDGDLN